MLITKKRKYMYKYNIHNRYEYFDNTLGYLKVININRRDPHSYIFDAMLAYIICDVQNARKYDISCFIILDNTTIKSYHV